MERLLTPDDVAELLGIPIPTLYDWRVKGRGPGAIKVGRHLRWRSADVQAWLDRQAEAQGVNDAK